MEDPQNVTGMFERFEREMHPSYTPLHEALPQRRFVAGYDIDDEAYEMELPVGKTLVVASLGAAVFWVGAALVLREAVRWVRRHG